MTFSFLRLPRASTYDIHQPLRSVRWNTPSSALAVGIFPPIHFGFDFFLMPCHPTTSEDHPLVTAFPHLCCNPLRPGSVGRVRFPFFPNIRSRIDVCLLAL